MPKIKLNLTHYLSALIALISFDALAQSSNQASSSFDNFTNKPTVTIGGFVNVTAAARDNKDIFNQDRLPDAIVSGDEASGGTVNPHSNSVDFANDSEIHIKVGGINEFGMKYGAVVELEADLSTDGRNEGFNADKSYVFTESRTGRFEFGNNIGANQKMKVGPSVFARAAGGINGKYLEYVNAPMLADSTQDGITGIGNCNGYANDDADEQCNKVKLPRFILIPQSPISHGGYAQGFYDRYYDNEYDKDVEANSGNYDNVGFIDGGDGSFGELEDATKVSYYTPRISGWQFGGSITPDTGNSGSSATIGGNLGGDIQNVMSWGANYSNNIGNLGVALSVTGEVGKAEESVYYDEKINDLNAYDVGVMATYFGFTIGGSYGSWGDSLTPQTGLYSCNYDSSKDFANQDCAADDAKKFDDATYYSAGLAYQFGPVAFSLTHLNSNFQENQYEATSFGVDYRLAKGLLPYLEVTQFEFESNHINTSDVNQSSLNADARQIQDNKGYVVLLGMLFSF